MNQIDLPNYLTTFTLLTAASVSANGNGSAIDLQPYQGVVAARVDAGNATAGTSPTLDLAVKQSSDNSNWSAANISFTQITNGSTEVISLDTRALYRYIRLDKTIGGTNSPAFPVAVIGIGVKQYRKT